MKTLLRSLVLFALSCTIFSSYAGPFGLEQGMSLEQLKKNAQIQEVTKFNQYTKSLPMGSKEMDGYIFLSAPNIGLCKVTALSKPITSNPNGSELKIEFNSYAKILTEKYGAPSTKHDFLHSNSIWKDPKYWMRSLNQNERELVHYWTTTANRPLPDSLQGIALGAEAASTSSGSLTIQYEYKNMTKCLEAMENSERQTKKETLKNF